MENASKALIIAGAILLAILLISLGIMIFTQAQDTINTSGMSQTEMQSFNNKFIKYEGLKKSGAEVKALINEVIASNADSNNTNRQVWVKLETAAATNDPTTSGISTASTYKVEMDYSSGGGNATYHTSTGCIWRIKITEN